MNIAKYCVRLLSNKTNSTVDTVQIKRIITANDVNQFAELTGDYNSIHFGDKDKPAFVHGAFLNGLISGILGTKLPGQGTIVISQTINYPNPCLVGDTVVVTVKILEKRKIIRCAYNIISSKTNTVVLDGEAKLIIAKDKNKSF